MRSMVPAATFVTLALCAFRPAAAVEQPAPAPAPAPAAVLPSNYFPFYVPWDDATPGTATDVSFLNHTPAGKFGRVIARDGHFVLAGNGERIRFFATNIAAQGAFPSRKEDADAIARSLAKRGINLVRLHHMDNPWAVGHGSIWDAKFPDRQHLDPAMLDRLDYLASRLIANGIYLNVNLKVSKTLTAADGFPKEAMAGLAAADFPLQKRVDHFDRRMIELQKDYARRLLAHVNPYTGRRYLDEPGVAVVEVNNENSLLSLWPGMPLGSGLDRLPDFFKRELTGQWNDWLKRKYATDTAMLAAWNGGIAPLGASASPPGVTWTSEQQSGAVCAIDTGPPTADALPDVDIRVTTVAGPDWHAQVHVVGVTLETGKPYTLAFEARSDAPRRTRVAATLDQAPWSECGLGETIATTPQWQRFTLPFVAVGAVPGHVRIGLAVADNGTPLHLRGVTLRAGSPPVTVNAGETLAAGNVSMPLRGAASQRRDYLDFLVDTDAAYAREMLQFLRSDLGMKNLACVTQVQWGGPAGYVREATADLIDAHGYIGHPEFPADADWSATRWTIANASETRRLADTGGSVLGDVAMTRQAGKPFTVSEFDQPAPSDFAAECVPMLAATAAAQDWDAVYTFCMPEYGADQPKAGVVTGFFDHLNHTAKAAFYPFAAVALRTGAIAPIEATATLRLPHGAYQTSPTVEAAWKQAWPSLAVLDTRLRVVPESPDATARVDVTAGSGPSPLSMIRAENGPVLRIGAPSAAGLVGFIGGATLEAGPMRVTTQSQGNQFAAVTVHTLDGRPVAETARGLVTVVGRTENVGMHWNAERTSVGDGWGTGPVHAEGLNLTVTLKRVRAAKVFALDEHGTRKAELPATFVGEKLQFVVDPKQATVFYEIAE